MSNETTYRKVFLFHIILILFFKQELFAQSPFSEYYNNINLAELAICDSNFSNASTYYKHAFVLKPQKAFSKDLLNAFFASMEVKQYLSAEKYLSQLMARGLGGRFIDGKILKFYQEEELQRVQQMLKKYLNDTLRENPLADKIIKMLEWDQGVRMYYSALNDGAYMTDSTYTVDSINAVALMNLFKIHGVPNESVLGNSKADDYAVTGYPDYELIIQHHNGGAFGGRPSHTMDPLLYKAVLNLDFDVHNFAALIDKSPLSDSIRLGNKTVLLPIAIDGFYYDNRIYSEYFDEASEKQMNEERAKIGLESLDDFRRKITGYNISKNKYSVLHKFFFTLSMTVQDGQDEFSLNMWLAVNGKDAAKKRSILNKNTGVVPVKVPIDYGNLGGKYVIGQRFGVFVDRYKYNFSKEYNQGQVFFANWRNGVPPLPWNYHAEVVNNPSVDLNSDTGRGIRARFIPGFKMLIEHGFDYIGLAYFRNIELLFDNDSLMRFTAKVDGDFYKAVIRRVSRPDTVFIQRDTVSCTHNGEQYVVLTKKVYRWEKGNIKMEFVSTDILNKKCVKYTSTIFSMEDKKKYSNYLKGVAIEKKKLDEEYQRK